MNTNILKTKIVIMFLVLFFKYEHTKLPIYYIINIRNIFNSTSRIKVEIWGLLKN